MHDIEKCFVLHASVKRITFFQTLNKEYIHGKSRVDYKHLVFCNQINFKFSCTIHEWDYCPVYYFEILIT
jgi:hypothetical protein